MSYRNNDCRIYVGNLPPDIRTKDIEDLFYKFGEIMFIDLKNRRGPPFAFVEFEDPRDADDTVQARDGYDYDGYRLRVEFSRRSGPGRSMGAPRGRGRRPPPRRSQYRVVVSGLPSTGSWQDLKDHMREAGDACYADVHKDGTGVVEFLRYEDMKYAVKKFDDSRFRSHEGEFAYIRVKEVYRSLSRSRSRRYTPTRTRGSPTYSKASRSRSRSHSRSRSRSYSTTRTRGSPTYLKASRSRSRSHSRSRSRSYSSTGTRGSPTYFPANRSRTRSHSRSRSRSYSPTRTRGSSTCSPANRSSSRSHSRSRSRSYSSTGTRGSPTYFPANRSRSRSHSRSTSRSYSPTRTRGSPTYSPTSRSRSRSYSRSSSQNAES